MTKKSDFHYLAKHDDFVLANYDFNLDTNKIFFSCLYKMNSDYYKPIESGLSYLYELDFDEIREKADINYDLENDRRAIDKITKDLTSKIVKIKTKTGYVFTGIVKSFRLDEVNKKLTIEIDKEVKPYLVEGFKKFTKLGFRHLSLCKSKYTFRLYEVLITKSKDFEEDKKLIKISVEEIREILKIPESINYSQFKERILEKAKNEYIALDVDEQKEESKLFKSFDYREIVTKQRGRGKNPITHIIFEFELLDETKILMLSKPDSIKKELDDEHWIMTELRILIDKNKTRNPYFASMSIHFFHGLVIQSIENAKKNNGIYGNLDQIRLLKSLERAFNSFKKSKDFETYLLNGISMGIQMTEKPE